MSAHEAETNTLTDSDDILRADGVKPFNGYLWPTEDWQPSHDKRFCNLRGVHRFHFSIVALADGRFSIEGMTCCIEQNTDNPYPPKGEAPSGRPVVFESRTAAIRTAAARMIRDILASRFWEYKGETMDRAVMALVINWTLQQVALACNAQKPKKIRLLPELEPPAAAGLELWDCQSKKTETRKEQ